MLVPLGGWTSERTGLDLQNATATPFGDCDWMDMHAMAPHAPGGQADLNM